MKDKETFGVELELITNGFKKKMQDLANTTKNMSNTIKNQYLSGWKVGLDVGNEKKELRELTKEAESLAKKYNIEIDVEKNGDITTSANEYKKLPNEAIEEFSKLQEKLSSTQNDLNNLDSIFGKVGQHMRDAFEDVVAFKNTKSNLKDLENGFEKLQDKIEKTDFDKMKKATEELAGTHFSDKEFNQMLIKLKQTKSELLEVIKLKAKVNGDGLSSIGGTKRSETETSENSGLGILDKFKDLGTKIKEPFTSNKGIVSKFGDSITGAFDKGIGSIKRFALALLGIRGIFGFISSQAKQLITSNEEMNAKVQVLSAGFQQLLAPVIERIVNLLSIAMSYLSSFIQMLTGVNILKKGMESVAKNSQKTANSTGTSAKNIDKMKGSLSGIDEITNIEQNSSSGSGGGGGGSSIPMPTFEEVQFPDFDKIGKTIAEKLNEAMAKIDWGKIQEGSRNIAQGIADNINDFCLTLDWGLLGKTIGEGINTGIYFSQTFIKKIEWRKIGDEMIKGLNGFIATVNWGALGDTIASGISGILDWASAMMEGFDAGQFIQSICDFFAGVDWGKLAESIVRFMVDKFIIMPAKIGLAIGEKIGEAATMAKDYFKDKIEESGGNVVEGIFNGIIDALTGIGEWIGDHVFTPIVDAFKNAFGIHSPSTVMAELAGYLIDGMLNKLKELPDKVKEVFNKAKESIINKLTEMKTSASNKSVEIVDGIKDKFKKIPDWFKDTFTKAWTNVKNVFSTGGKIFDGIKDGIANTFKTIVNGLISGINKVIATPFKKINEMLNTIRSVDVLGIKPFKSMWGYNPLPIPAISCLQAGSGPSDHQYETRSK